MKILDFFTYPIKSCSAIASDSLRFSQSGPLFDREWVLIDAKNRFLSQREIPELAAIKVGIQSNEMILTHLNGSQLKISTSSNYQCPLNQRSTVTIWNETVEASVEEDKVNQILSEWCHQPVRLARYLKSSPRIRTKTFGEFETRFSDGYPILLTNINSLKKLSTDAGEEIPMDRFRSNIVIEAPELIETQANSVKIGTQVFKVAQACQRCVMIGIDQNAGVMTKSKALKTLVDWNLKERKPQFGIYLVPPIGAEEIFKSDLISFVS